MPLINRNFALLWCGQLVSQLGDKAYNLVLMWWLLEKTASPVYVSAFLIASTLPELICGPLAGVYIDRWPKRAILVAADFARGTLVLTLAALYQAGSLATWHIYGAALLISLGSALFNPTTMAVIPLAVEKRQLQRANALSQLVAGTVAIAGPLLGACGLSLLGYQGVLLFNGVSYILSGLAAAALRLRAAQAAARESLLASLLQGFHYIRGDRRVIVVVLIVAVIHVFFGSLAVILPFLANRLAGSGIVNLGSLEAALGAGLLAGGICISRRADGPLRTLALYRTIGGMGLAIAALGALQLARVQQVAPYAAGCLLIGASVAVISVFWRTITQLCVPETMSGRVFSVLSTTGNISLPIAMGLFGLLLRHYPPAGLLAFAGISLSFIALVLIAKSRTLFDGLRP